MSSPTGTIGPPSPVRTRTIRWRTSRRPRPSGSTLRLGTCARRARTGSGLYPERATHPWFLDRGSPLAGHCAQELCTDNVHAWHPMGRTPCWCSRRTPSGALRTRCEPGCRGRCVGVARRRRASLWLSSTPTRVWPPVTASAVRPASDRWSAAARHWPTVSAPYSRIGTGAGVRRSGSRRSRCAARPLGRRTRDRRAEHLAAGGAVRSGRTAPPSQRAVEHPVHSRVPHQRTAVPGPVVAFCREQRQRGSDRSSPACCGGLPPGSAPSPRSDWR